MPEPFKKDHCAFTRQKEKSPSILFNASEDPNPKEPAQYKEKIQTKAILCPL
jgi:hypothetical protein